MNICKFGYRYVPLYKLLKPYYEQMIQHLAGQQYTQDSNTDLQGFVKISESPKQSCWKIKYCPSCSTPLPMDIFNAKYPFELCQRHIIAASPLLISAN